MKTNVSAQAKKLLAASALATLATLAAAPVWAATKTVTLSVPGMICAACPITVKKALNKVDGVAKTEINLERREAVVTFNDSRNNVQALTRATENAGYSSTEVR